MSPRTTPAPPALSPFRVHGDTIYVSGQVGFDTSGELVETLEEQIELSMQNLASVLRSAGSGLEHVIRTNCYLSSMDDFHTFNTIYASHFAAPFPARTTIGVELLGNIKFEIDAVAALPN